MVAGRWRGAIDVASSRAIADYVTLPGGAHLGGSDCPVGAALATGDALSWTSTGTAQGSVGSQSGDNGCAAKGTCGLPYSQHGRGGGWQPTSLQRLHRAQGRGGGQLRGGQQPPGQLRTVPAQRGAQGRGGGRGRGRQWQRMESDDAAESGDNTYADWGAAHPVYGVI